MGDSPLSAPDSSPAQSSEGSGKEGEQKTSYEDLDTQYRASSKESREQKSRADQAEKELADIKQWQNQAMPLLQTIADDTDLRDRLEKKMAGEETKPSPEQTSSGLSEKDRKLLEETREERTSKEQQKNEEVKAIAKKFMDTRKIGSDADKAALIKLAQRFDGGINPRTGKLYDVSAALSDAYLIMHPESIADKAKLEALAESEKRSAASEAGDISGVSSAGESEPALTGEERYVAEKLGVKPEKYAKRKAEIESTK